MSISVRRFLCRARSVESLLEDWLVERDRSKFAADADALAGECIDLAGLCQLAWESIRASLRADPNTDELDAAGKIMKAALPKTQDAFTVVQELIAEATRKGASLTNATAFEAASTQVRNVRGLIDKVFPELDEAMAAESLAEYLRGDYQTAEDLIREIQGHSVSAH